MSENETTGTGVPHQTIIINQKRHTSNGLGTAGFILALIALIICWVPILAWIMWILGFVFSFIGVFKRPRGLAIAGLIISLVGLIFILVVSAFIVAWLTLS